MRPWVPISLHELESLVANQLADGPPDIATLFDRLRVPFRQVNLSRFGNRESVFVVAQAGTIVMYYEDVEEGFNVSELLSDGSIATPGCEQFDLATATNHLLSSASGIELRLNL